MGNRWMHTACAEYPWRAKICSCDGCGYQYRLVLLQGECLSAAAERHQKDTIAGIAGIGDPIFCAPTQRRNPLANTGLYHEGREVCRCDSTTGQKGLIGLFAPRRCRSAESCCSSEGIVELSNLKQAHLKRKSLHERPDRDLVPGPGQFHIQTQMGTIVIELAPKWNGSSVSASQKLGEIIGADTRNLEELMVLSLQEQFRLWRAKA